MGDVSGTTLALFTGLTPTGAFAFIALALALLARPGIDRAEHDRTMHLLAIPLAVTWFGFIASATHLGTPANALYAFTGAGRSPLSNEVVAVVVFLFVSGLLWLYSFKRDHSLAVARIGLAASVLAAVGLLAFTSAAYNVSTVPTWTTPLGPANLLLGGASAGCALAAATMHLAQRQSSAAQWAMLALAALALVAGSATNLMYGNFVAGIGNNIQPAGTLGESYPALVAVHLVLGIAGLALQVFARRNRSGAKRALALDAAGAALAAAAAVLMRLPFYASYLSVGF